MPLSCMLLTIGVKINWTWHFMVMCQARVQDQYVACAVWLHCIVCSMVEVAGAAQSMGCAVIYLI